MLTIIWILIAQLAEASNCTCNYEINDVCTINQSCNMTFITENNVLNFNNLSIQYCTISICFYELTINATIHVNGQLLMQNVTINHDSSCAISNRPQLLINASYVNIVDTHILLFLTVNFQTYDFGAIDSHLEAYQFSICSTNKGHFNNTVVETQRQNKSTCSCLYNEKCVNNQTQTETQLFDYFQNITNNFQNDNLTVGELAKEWQNNFQCGLFQPKVLQYFTIIIAAGNSTHLLRETKIKGFFIGIYSQIIYNDINSVILSDGMGYITNEGFGCGYTDKIIGLRQQCGGTGGSHGGAGGFSISPKSRYNQLCLQLKSKAIYDDPFNPTIPGSGGGGVTYGSLSGRVLTQGQGGGVIYIESVNITNEGLISSNGTEYLGQPFFGSGSGGAIQLRMMLINGSGFITASGGGAQADSFENSYYEYAKQKFYQSYSVYGGFGGGGRIRIMFINISEMILNRMTYNYTNNTVKADPGSCSMEQLQALNVNNYSLVNYHGSITPTGCPQGTRGKFCHFCPKGKYKYLFGQAECQPCFNQLNYYSNYSTLGEVIPFCNITCINEGKMIKNECLTGLGEFGEKLGGENSIFSLFVIIILLLINIAIIWISKETRQKKQRQFYGSYDDSTYQQLSGVVNELNNKTYLVSQDLPFHVKRVYVNGRNLYDDPWEIFYESAQDLEQEENDELTLLIENFNNIAKYQPWERTLLISFKFYYYPFYLWILQLRQSSKFASLSTLFEKQDQIFEKQDNDPSKDRKQNIYRLKFSCSKDKSLAFLDKLNQGLDILQQSNTLDLPITLVLSGYGTFQYPYQINIHDAMIKRLWQQFRKYGNEDEDSINLFEKFVATFNYFAVKIDFRQSSSSFVKRFSDLLQYTNDSNEVIFSTINTNNEKLWVDICLHLIHNQGKSQVIQIGQPNQREFEDLLQKIHYLQNFTTDFVIKVSVIFDYLYRDRRTNLRVFTNVEPTKCVSQNINQQLTLVTAKESEEKSDERKKMLQKMDKNRLDVKEYKKQRYLVFKRGFTWLISQITRYRENNINPQLLIAGICILLAIQWLFVIAYPVILFIVYENQQATGDYQVFEAEFFTQIIVFPFAQIISLAILSAWLLKSRRNYGKMYLLFNLCGLASSFIEFIYGCYDLFNFNSSAEFNLFKLFPFFFILLSSHLVSLQMNQNEKNKIKYFE